MRKLLAALVAAFCISTAPLAHAGECNQGTAAEFREMIAGDARATSLFLAITDLSVIETKLVLSIINPDNILTDQKFETAILALRKDGIAFIVPMVGWQICGMFTLQPATVERVLKALQGVNA